VRVYRHGGVRSQQCRMRVNKPQVVNKGRKCWSFQWQRSGRSHKVRRGMRCMCVRREVKAGEARSREAKVQSRV